MSRVRGHFFLGLAFLLLLIVSRAECHQAFDTETNIRLLPNRISLKITLTNAIAAGLLTTNSPEEISIDHTNLENLRPRLMDLAAQLYEITAGGTPLAPTSRQVTLGHNGDVDFLLSYPHPRQGTLNFRALFVQKIPPACTGSVTALDEVGNPLGNKILQHQDDSLEVSTQPATPTPTPPTAQPSPSPIPKPSFQSLLASSVAPIVGCNLLILLVFLLVIRRRSPSDKH